MKKRNFELCSYALLFSIKNKTVLEDFNIDKIIESNHCILLLLSFLYCQLNKLDDSKLMLTEVAKNFSKNREDFERYWVFVYEVLSEQNLHNEYKNLKKAKISFINKSKLSYKNIKRKNNRKKRLN